jgi:excisionase family DNA binding protein
MGDFSRRFAVSLSLPDPAERPTLTVEDAAELLGIGRSAAYAAAREFIRTDGASGLPAIRLGRRLLVPTAALLRLLAVTS